MSTDFDLVVIGAGPAGMAAAVTASIHGLRTAVLDENAGPGGQIYRAITTTPVKKRKILGDDYWFGEQFTLVDIAFVPFIDRYVFRLILVLSSDVNTRSFVVVSRKYGCVCFLVAVAWLLMVPPSDQMVAM